MSTGTPTADGLTYGPTAAGTTYISLYYHRGGRKPDKNYWEPAFTPGEEYALFDHAETEEWSDTQDHLWGIVDGGKTILGLRGEKIARFPAPQNDSDPWHGYPVSPKDRYDDVPPDEVIDRWSDTNVITRAVARRIKKGKI